MLKKGDDNNTKSECESNFVLEIEKMKKMPRKTGVNVKISIGKNEKWQNLE